MMTGERKTYWPLSNKYNTVFIGARHCWNLFVYSSFMTQVNALWYFAGMCLILFICLEILQNRYQYIFYFTYLYSSRIKQANKNPMWPQPQTQQQQEVLWAFCPRFKSHYLQTATSLHTLYCSRSVGLLFLCLNSLYLFNTQKAYQCNAL